MLILAPQTIRVHFEISPALNAVDDLLLLSSFENQSGFSDWVTRTRESLSPQRRHLHDLLITGLKLLDHEGEWSDFDAYLDHIAALDALELRDKAIDWMCKPEKVAHMGLEPANKDTLLNDLDAYLDFNQQVAAYYQAHYADKDFYNLDEALLTEMHQLLNDPELLKETYVGHLRSMWREIVEPEWKRVQPMIQESVEAFRQLDVSGMTAVEAIRVVTGRDLSGHWEEDLRDLDELVFVPSAHIGPYVRLIRRKEEHFGYLMFGARLPQGTRVQSPALTRSELLVRFNALADDTRLQILELLTEHDELCAQDIMTMLDLSQSSASRHLRQLTATGYLTERRREVAKCYSLNTDRVEDTLQALRRFLKT